MSGEWSSWKGPVGPEIGNSVQGYATYSFDPKTGNFTVSGQAGTRWNDGFTWYMPWENKYAPYIGSRNVGKTLTRWKYYGNRDYYHEKDHYVSTKTAVPVETITETTFDSETISKAGIYSNNGVYTVNGEERMYKENGNAKAYYLYKYQERDIKTIYDVRNGIINTKKINFNKNKDTVKILVQASNNNYKLSISQDNQNWVEISNKASLNGKTDISLPSMWNGVYIKIERNNSIINHIEVK